MSDCDIRL